MGLSSPTHKDQIMNKTLSIVTAITALATAVTSPAQSRAETRLIGGNVEARIVEPAGVDVYFVFQGVGINGAVEIPGTLGNCLNPVSFTIGPLATHNHQHTIDWTDCTNTKHRWSIPIPVNSQWLAGSVLPRASEYGFGCGQNAPVSHAIDDEPALGSTRTFTVSDLPASTTVAITNLSLASVPGWGYPLTQLGIAAPECYVFIDLGTAMGIGAAIAPGSSASFSVTMPASAAFTGMIAYAQAAALSPGQNPAGVVTSNGLSLLLAQ